DAIPARRAGIEQAAGLGLSRAHRLPVATRHGRPVTIRGVPSDLFLSRRGVLHKNQWSAALRARDRAEATRPGILQESLSVGLAGRRRSQPGHRTESVLVGIDGEAIPRSADKGVIVLRAA